MYYQQPMMLKEQNNNNNNRKNNGGNPFTAFFLVLLIAGLAFVALNFDKVMNYIETGKYEEPSDVTPTDNNNNNKYNNDNKREEKKEEKKEEKPEEKKEEKKEEQQDNKQEEKKEEEKKQEDDEEIVSILSLLPFDKVFLNNDENAENGYSGPNDKETTFYISPGAASVKIDAYYTFKVVRSSDVANGRVEWSTSDSKIATITSEGKVKGLKSGIVTITAKIPEGPEAKATLYVINQGLDMSTATSLPVGKTAGIAIPEAYRGKTKFYSSNPKIASVDDTGKITTHRTGTVTITGVSGNFTNSITLTVTGSRIHFINTHDASDAILLESNNHFALIDTGGVKWDTSRKYFFEYLDSLGLKEEGFEFVILTNQHADHNGGMVSLLNKGYPVKKIYMKSYNSNDDHSEKIVERYNTIIETAQQHNVSISYVDKESKFKEEESKSGTVDLDDMRVYFFNTIQRLDNGNKSDFNYYTSNYFSGYSENINSIVNLVRVNTHNILLTSDLNNSDVFNGVMKNKVKMVWNRNEKIDIYKINNHGNFDCTGNSNMEINATNYVVTNNIDQEFTSAKGNGYMITNDKVIYNSKENESCFKRIGVNMCDAYYSSNSNGALIFSLLDGEVKVTGTKGVDASKRCK